MGDLGILVWFLSHQFTTALKSKVKSIIVIWIRRRVAANAILQGRMLLNPCCHEHMIGVVRDQLEASVASAVYLQYYSATR